jgi:hypothetical protein
VIRPLPSHPVAPTPSIHPRRTRPVNKERPLICASFCCGTQPGNRKLIASPTKPGSAKAADPRRSPVPTQAGWRPWTTCPSVRRRQVADRQLAELRRGLAQQPSELLGRLWLGVVLNEVHLDELCDGRGLGPAVLLAKAFERPVESLCRGVLGREAAALHTPRIATADPVPVRPDRRVIAA